MNFANFRFFTILFFTTLLFTANSYALPEDNEQPINISADKATKNDNKGITKYSGDVIMIQGSIKISGDEVTIYDKNGEVQKIVAVGKPAKFQQQPEADGELVIANALTINYNMKSESLVLEEKAYLKQSGKITESNKITYDMTASTFNAGDGSGRVIMIIPPSPE